MSSTPDPETTPSSPTPRKPPGVGWPLDYEGEFNLPLFVIALSGVWLGVFLYGGPVLRGPGGIALVTWGGILSVASGLCLLEQHRDIRFRRWLLEHWAEIVAGEARLHGRAVDPQTPLVRYAVVFSLLEIRMTMSSRPVLPRCPDAVRTRRASSIITALAGWWSINGFTSTPQALRSNLRDEPVSIRLADVANATLQAKPLDSIEFD